MNEHTLSDALASLDVDPADVDRLRNFDPSAVLAHRRRANRVRVAAGAAAIATVLGVGLVAARFGTVATDRDPVAATSATPVVTLHIDEQQRLTSRFAIGDLVLTPVPRAYTPVITAMDGFEAAGTASRPVLGPAAIFLAEVAETPSTSPHPAWVVLQRGGPSATTGQPTSAGRIATELRDPPSYSGRVSACLVSPTDSSVFTTVTGDISP